MQKSMQDIMCHAGSFKKTGEVQDVNNECVKVKADYKHEEHQD